MAVKVLALDYGSARTGIAVSDPTGTVARPVGVAEKVGTPAGLEQLLAAIRAEEPERVVVGMPFTLRGEEGEQARETLGFVETLRGAVDIPVVTYDERFTSSLAGGDDARAAAYLLTSYLEWLGRPS
jgi:putative holliday junction resolvase